MEKATRASVLQYAAEQYGTEAESPWPETPENCVLRHVDNCKWFAAVLRVSRAALGLTGDGWIDVLDLKCDPVLIGSLVDTAGFRPAYHMNKTHWITALLDGSADGGTVKRLIDLSYSLTGSKPRKR